MINRALLLNNDNDRTDLSLYLRHLVQLNPSVIIRLQQSGERVLIWADPGFGSLAVRGVSGRIDGDDRVASADAVLAGLQDAQRRGELSSDVGVRMDSSWYGELPPLADFSHVDEVKSADIVDLAERAQRTASDLPGAVGIPTSLLNQEVIVLNSDDGESGTRQLGIRLRSLFTLTSCGFIRMDQKRRVPENDVVLVRASKDWIRLDAVYGSVAQRLTPEPRFNLLRTLS